VTAAWTRRAWVAVVFIVVLFTALVAVKAGESSGAIAAGVVAGLLAAAIVYSVLRFDARTIPGYVVAAALLSGADNAALAATAAGWTAFAISAVVSIAAGFAATRYLDRPLLPRDAVPAVAAPA
jgi:hypothetical protein